MMERPAPVADSDLRRLRNWTGILMMLIVTGVPGLAAQAPVSPSDSLAALTSMYRAALENGIRTAHARERPALVCVAGLWGEPPKALLRALADSAAQLVRPASACRIDPLTRPPRGISLVVDTLTGRRGIEIRVTGAAFDKTGTFSFRTRYYEHGLSAADWECTGRRNGSTWTVISCRMTRIS